MKAFLYSGLLVLSRNSGKLFAQIRMNFINFKALLCRNFYITIIFESLDKKESDSTEYSSLEIAR